MSRPLPTLVNKKESTSLTAFPLNKNIVATKSANAVLPKPRHRSYSTKKMYKRSHSTVSASNDQKKTSSRISPIVQFAQILSVKIDNVEELTSNISEDRRNQIIESVINKNNTIKSLLLLCQQGEICCFSSEEQFIVFKGILSCIYNDFNSISDINVSVEMSYMFHSIWELLMLFLSNVYDNIRSVIITRRFIRDIIQLSTHTSNLLSEQSLSFLECLLIKYNDYCPLFLDIVKNYIYDHLHHQYSFQLIIHLLNILLWAINEQNIVHHIHYEVFFRSIIVHLYKSPNYPEFFNPLSLLSLSFYSSSTTNCEWLIHYLIQHWPRTNIDKYCLFLKELSSLMMYASEQYLTMQIDTLTNFFLDAIQFDHTKIILLTIDIVFETNFLQIIAPISSKFYYKLDSLISSMVSHWSHDIRMKISTLKLPITFSSIFNNPNNTKYLTHDHSNYVKQTWNNLGMLSSYYYPSNSIILS